MKYTWIILALFTLIGILPAYGQQAAIETPDKGITNTATVTLVVVAAGSLPASGMLAIATLAVTLAALTLVVLMRRRQMA